MTGKYKQYLITFNLYDGTVRTVPIDIPLGEPGADGGYYVPETEQISDTEFRVSFKPSKDGMPAVDPVTMYSFSPRLTVTETEEGAEVSAEDNLGTSTVVIRNGKNGITPVKGIDYSDGFSPTATVTRETNGVKITITDKNGTTTQTVPVGAEGNAIYYMSIEVEYPEPEPEDGGISFTTYNVPTSMLSNGGIGIKTGDIIVASNGTICKVSSISIGSVNYEPIGTISGVIADGGTAGKDGFSVYSSSVILFVKIDEVVSIDPDSINTYGREIQIGDHIISSNGFIGVVTSFTSSGHPNVKILADLKGAKGDNYVLTPADKTEMVSAVLAALPTWTGGSY